MTEPNGKNGVKTLGIKLPPELHTQFALVAQLDGMPLSTAVQRAVEHYVAAKQSEDDFATRAQEALEEIEREAATRRGAIQALFGQNNVQADDTPEPKAETADDAEEAAEDDKPKASRSRRK